jgi:hypothetical protein
MNGGTMFGFQVDDPINLSVSGGMSEAWFWTKRCMVLARPQKARKSVQEVGGCKSLIAKTQEGETLTVLPLMRRPTY